MGVPQMVGLEGKIPYRNGWELGVPLFQEPPYQTIRTIPHSHTSGCPSCNASSILCCWTDNFAGRTTKYLNDFALTELHRWNWPRWVTMNDSTCLIQRIYSSYVPLLSNSISVSLKMWYLKNHKDTHHHSHWFPKQCGHTERFLRWGLRPGV